MCFVKLVWLPRKCGERKGSVILEFNFHYLKPEIEKHLAYWVAIS